MNYQNDKKEQLEDLANDILEQIPYDESDYNSYNINNNNDFVDAVEQLKIILITYGYEEIDLITYENIIKIVKNYFYVKQNKKLYPDYVNSNIDDLIKKLINIINNAEIYSNNDIKFQIISLIYNAFNEIYKLKLSVENNWLSGRKKALNRIWNEMINYIISYKNISKIFEKNYIDEEYKNL